MKAALWADVVTLYISIILSSLVVLLNWLFNEAVSNMTV
jgi:hypothetical protein